MHVTKMRSLRKKRKGGGKLTFQGWKSCLSASNKGQAGRSSSERTLLIFLKYVRSSMKGLPLTKQNRSDEPENGRGCEERGAGRKATQKLREERVFLEGRTQSRTWMEREKESKESSFCKLIALMHRLTSGRGGGWNLRSLYLDTYLCSVILLSPNNPLRDGSRSFEKLPIPFVLVIIPLHPFSMEILTTRWISFFLFCHL